jgi:hypothetical protein
MAKLGASTVLKGAVMGFPHFGHLSAEFSVAGLWGLVLGIVWVIGVGFCCGWSIDFYFVDFCAPWDLAVGEDFFFYLVVWGVCGFFY